MTTKEYSSYIKGLIEGTNLNLTTPEGKIISALAELADQMAGEIETLRDELDVCNQYIEEVDEDLGAVEELIYDDCDCDCDCCDDDCGDDDECDDECCCGCCDDEDEDEDEEEFYCAMCPHCGGKVYFDDTVNPEDVICPACQKPILEDENEE